MDTILEHIDPQVVFVIIALLIGGGQALMELIRKRRAEMEARRELARRGERRVARPAANDHGPPPLADSFEELYEEYRRSILQDQQRPPGEAEQHVPPWQVPAQTAPPGPPTPPPLPSPVQAAPKAPVATKPPAVDAEPEPWVEPALSVAQAWQAPAAAKPQLNAAELAALEALRQRKRAKQTAGGTPGRRLPTRREDWRRAVLLREVLGPPKSLS